MESKKLEKFLKKEIKTKKGKKQEWMWELIGFSLAIVALVVGLCSEIDVENLVGFLMVAIVIIFCLCINSIRKLFIRVSDNEVKEYAEQKLTQIGTDLSSIPNRIEDAKKVIEREYDEIKKKLIQEKKELKGYVTGKKVS